MLTKEEILSKSPNIQSLSQIKTLNLWGKELEEVSIITQMPNLEIISLSANKISSLSVFSSCKMLKELYLRRNNISSLSEIDHLANCPSLTILWIDQNPIFKEDNYHNYIITKLPQLIKLDNVIVNRKIQKGKINIFNRVMTITQSIAFEKPKQQNDHNGYDRELTEINRKGDKTPSAKLLKRYQSFNHFFDNKTNTSTENTKETGSSKKVLLKLKDGCMKSQEKKERKFPVLIDKPKDLKKNEFNCKSTNFMRIPTGKEPKKTATILKMFNDIDLKDMQFLYKELEKRIILKQKES